MAGARGPLVDASEDLFRCITTRDWWVSEAGRPSSAAFDEPKFSVNIASLTTVAETECSSKNSWANPMVALCPFDAGEHENWVSMPGKRLTSNSPTTKCTHTFTMMAAGVVGRKVRVDWLRNVSRYSRHRLAKLTRPRSFLGRDNLQDGLPQYDWETGPSFDNLRQIGRQIGTENGFAGLAP